MIYVCYNVDLLQHLAVDKKGKLLHCKLDKIVTSDQITNHVCNFFGLINT